MVADLVLEGEGMAVLKIWSDNISVYAERLEDKPKKGRDRAGNKSIFVEAYLKMGQLDRNK